VVDNTRLIQAGKRVRPTIRFVDCDDDQAVFHEIQDVDLMFISCALHYIPQWESFIQRILKQYRPGLLYIARHYSPDVLNAPAFATQRIYTGSDYAGEAVLHLLPERLLTQQLSASYHKVLSTVNSIPDYFPSTFDALNIRERNILFRRKSD
jgi:trans-aconitate methyltransferase